MAPVVFGLATFRAWTTLLFHDVNVNFSQTSSTYLESPQYLTLEFATLATFCIILFLSALSRYDIKARHLWVITVLAIAASVALPIDTHIMPLPDVLTYGTSVCIGIALGVYLVLWGIALMRFPRNAIIVSVLAGMVLDRLLYFVGILLPWQALFVVDLLLPLCTMLCWTANQKQADRLVVAPSPVPVDKTSLRRIPWAMLAILSICQTACSVFTGLMVSLINPQESGTVNVLMLALSGFVVLLLLLLSARARRSQTFWTEFLLIIVAGIIGFLVFGGQHLLLCIGIVHAGGYAFVTFYMLLFPIMAQERKLPGLFFITVANLICYRGPEFIGVLIGKGIGTYFLLQSIPVTTAALALVLVLFGVLVFAFNHASSFSSAAENAAADTTDQVNAIARQYGLAERELEIALLMAKGRSARYISEELHLSQSTVHTYQRRMYQKLQIHSKQEFIDMLERER